VSLEVALGKRFARLATNVVVRNDKAWRLLRGPLRTQFERLAPMWDTMRSPDAFAPLEAALAALDTSPRRVLDLGTGTGRAAIAFARRFPAAEVIGVDFAQAMVDEATRLLPDELRPRVRFERADASALPFANDEFDVVVLANMIPFFDELSRVTAAGGAAVFSFSLGAGTPIYVPEERLRRELAQRGFAEFASFSAGAGTAFVARKQ
jgi:SAM-dependent methyltransferase